MPVSLRLKMLCAQSLQSAKDCCNNLKEIQGLVQVLPPQLIQKMQTNILCVAFPVFKSIQENKEIVKENDRLELVNLFKAVFDKSKIEKLALFFNIYSFLLFEVYDHLNNKVRNISEEYKLGIMNCMVSLSNAVCQDIVIDLYVKENALKLCQMLHAALEIAKTEKLRALRISAMDCIASMARLNENDDLELQCATADVFMFFLPGITTGLKDIALEDEKSGHKVSVAALEMWGKLLVMQLQNYNAADQVEVLRMSLENEVLVDAISKNKWKTEEEVKTYIKNTERNGQWYKNTDKNLELIIQKFSKLVQHSHWKVRLQLAHTCGSLLEKCASTAPKCTGKAVDLLIALSEDENAEVSLLSKEKLQILSLNISRGSLQSIFENIQDNFFNLVKSIPRIFNRMDQNEQLTALNSLSGYLQLFGNNQLNIIFHSSPHLNHLLLTLIHISEVEKTEVKLLEDYSGIELNVVDNMDPWLRFCYFESNDIIREKLEKICCTFVKFEVAEIITDFLLDVYQNDAEHKSEATYILNNLFNDTVDLSSCQHVLKSVIETYLEPANWNLPYDVPENEISLKEARSNVIQMCLQTEGIGKFALALREDYQQFLLKSLYLVLEKAGSANTLIRLAGLKALHNIIRACKYSSVTELISLNSDYFSHYVIMKLNRSQHNENALNVLAVVLNYSTIDVMPSIADIIDDILMRSCDKFHEKHSNSFLRIFKIFIQRLLKWYNIKPDIKPIKSKVQKEKEFEQFSVSNIKFDNNFSDEIMGKTAEEMYKEDLEKSQKEIEEEYQNETEEYKKPKPLMHVKIVVSILKRSLNFLPSKNTHRKILVLEILQLGVEVIRDWEDELLPIVHQIWSPFVDRFKENTEPLIVNLSFQLLVVLARLTKDFIRARTIRDVFPNLKKIISNSAKESLLQDRGSSFRYTQIYKLQLVVLQQLGRIIVDLDMLDETTESIIDCVVPYLSIQQPVPLQEACVEFFKTLTEYDYKLVKRKISTVNNMDSEKNQQLILKYVEEIETQENSI